MNTPVRPTGPTPSPASPPAASPTRSSGWWTTVISGAITIFSFLDSQAVLNILPPKVAATIAAVGALLTTWGVLKHTDQASAS